MKTLCSVLLSLLGFASFAQPNNPYQKRGAEFFSSVLMIGENIQSGSVKEFNEEFIQAYAKKVPFPVQANLELAVQVYKQLHDPAFNLDRLISTARVSDATKKFTYQLLNPSLGKGETMQGYLTKLTEQVNQTSLDPLEKETLLTLNALRYELETNLSARRSLCDLELPSGYTLNVSNGVCIAAFAVAGAYIGYHVCGLKCAVAGAVIGAVVGTVGSISGTKD